MFNNEPLDRIEINPKIMIGKPVIKGTGLTVELIIGLLGRGITIDEVLEQHKRITEQDVLAFALA